MPSVYKGQISTKGNRLVDLIVHAPTPEHACQLYSRLDTILGSRISMQRDGEASLKAELELPIPEIASSSAVYLNVTLRPLNGEITKVDFWDTIVNSPKFRDSTPDYVRLLFEPPTCGPTRLSVYYLPNS